MWQNQLQEVPERDHEKLVRATNLLLAHTFLVRDIYDRQQQRLRTNEHYNTAERYLDYLRAWFDMAGWDLHRDTGLGIINITNRFGYNRMRIDKNATVFLLALRLIFEEQREKLSLRKEVTTTVRELTDKLMTLGVIERRLPDRALRDGLNFLRSFNIIERLDGPVTDLDTKLLIYPTILLAIPNERISRLSEMLKSSGADDQDEEDDEDETS